MIRSILAVLLFYSVSLLGKETPHFAIVAASYNNGSSNSKRCIAHLESIRKQSYTNYTVYITEDCSTDETGELIDRYCSDCAFWDKVEVTHNTKRKGQHRNIYEMIHKLDPHDIVIILDGDDELANPQVLAKLAEVYSDDKVWLTYGSYEIIPGYKPPHARRPLPLHITRERKVRSHQWITSHLRTFYAGLYHKIKKEDLMWEGNFVPCAGDVAIMFPMIEMAANDHTKFIHDILCLYYVANPLNIFKKKMWLQQKIEKHLRSKEPYEPLYELFPRRTKESVCSS